MTNSTDNTKDAVQKAMDQAKDAAKTTIDAAQQAAQTTAVTTREATHAVRDAAKDAGKTTADSAQRLKKWDEQRSDFPGEHLVVAGVGLALFLMAGKSSSPLKKMLLTAVGTAALTRAASGRGGVARIASWLVNK